MLSYRHGFHAGNPADVLKHAVLVFCLEYLRQKEKPFLCVDTHAGAGAYPLLEGFAAKNREWEQGIARLSGREGPPLIRRYRDLAGFPDEPRISQNPVGFEKCPEKSGLKPSFSHKFKAAFPKAEVLGKPQLCGLKPPSPSGAGDGKRDPSKAAADYAYPGSPALTARLLRPRDRGLCFELHPGDFAALSRLLGGDRRFILMREDGFAGLKAFLPPPSRRGLVFIDPSYEVKEDYTRLAGALAEALRRFPTGIYIIWRPLLGKDPRPGTGAEFLEETLLGLYRGKRLGLELYTAPSGPRRESPRGFYGSGLVIYNPPWPLEEALRESLPFLGETMGTGPEGWRLRIRED
jgi:23S rRNA (adenine2030-N6)-methyltransferase